MRPVFVFIFLVVFSITSASAKQVSFRKYNYGNDIVFTYKFKDYTRSVQNLSFTVTEKDIAKDIRRFERLDERSLSDAVVKNIQSSIAVSFPDVDVNIRRFGKSIKINAKSYSNERLREAMSFIKNQEEQTKADLLHSYYYTRDKTGNYILPDHPRISDNFIHFANPIAKTIDEKLRDRSDREKINYILSFLQTIPYDKLQNRQTSNGSGFVTPLELFKKNRGDCDSKSVAFAAILKNLLPTADTVMVYVPGHALVAVGVPPQEGDNTIQIEGKSFVLAEPVGPGLLPIGYVSDRSLQSLRSNNFTFKYF